MIENNTALEEFKVVGKSPFCNERALFLVNKISDLSLDEDGECVDSGFTWKVVI